MNSRMLVPAPFPRRPRAAQRGLSLISVLVAIVVFALGMLSIASIYSLAVPAQTANQEAANTAAFGNQFWALLQADPGVVGQLGANTTVSYPTTAISAAPNVLQPWLQGIFSNAQSRLPDASVTITTGKGAEGNACAAATPSTTLCGVKLTVAWQTGTLASSQHTQTYDYQVGF
ncbi:hypothetical protein GALL_463620 [mine drainage metagenome]|uniref:Tfp pilus assembly protein PilV n=1 Tax=mine drainage metagenome TaxID=410659 RepID=A0A1J5PMJ4_9ZZZZ